MQLPYIWTHPKYNHPVRRRTRLFAHDEYELCDDGDLARAAAAPPHAAAAALLTARSAAPQVKLGTSRPLSKFKSHIVDKILKKENGEDAPDPFPNA